MTTQTAQDQDQNKKAYPLRIDGKLFLQVQARARSEGRSVNKQIEQLLRQSLSTDK